ncbi:MAG TPA: cysteine rich repeat-containing protein [Methylococcus sp.]|nr:cysteine rich repeat-containing protein [Methylococcus sp.]
MAKFVQETRIVVIGGIWLATLAASPLGARERNLPCSEDIAKFCPGLGLGEGKIQRCLEEHKEELSADCRPRFEAALSRSHEIRHACAADVAKFCREVAPGKGRLAQCLRRHHRQVSSACMERLREARKIARTLKGG